jgi:hypothetical protein
MSHEIIKSIKIDSKNKKVFITSYSNNITPKIFKKWHCSYYDDFFDKGGVEAIQKHILFSFFSGVNQGLSTNYGKAMQLFKYEGDSYEIYKKCDDDEDFKSSFYNKLFSHFQEFETKRKSKRLFNIKVGRSWIYIIKRGGAATCESQASAKKFNLATAETLLKRFASSKPELIEIQDF